MRDAELLQPRSTTDIQLCLPADTAYAGDVDFATTNGQWLQSMMPSIATPLLTGDLIVNETKTELTHVELCLDRVAEKWRVTRKLGSQLGEPWTMLPRSGGSRGNWVPSWVNRMT